MGSFVLAAGSCKTDSFIIARKSDKRFQELLLEYHSQTTNRFEVSARLAREHGISASARTVSRRWKDMGLSGSTGTEAQLSRGKIVQLVADQMSLDPAGRVGQNTMKKQIALRTGVHLKW